MKTANLIRISVAVAIICASANVTALAQKDLRLIPADTGGTDNDEISIGMGTKYIILGTPGSAQGLRHNFLRAKTKKWKETASLTGDGGGFGRAVDVTDVRGQSNSAFAIVGAPDSDAGEAYVFALSGRDWKTPGEAPIQ